MEKQYRVIRIVVEFTHQKEPMCIYYDDIVRFKDGWIQCREFSTYVDQTYEEIKELLHV